MSTQDERLSAIISRTRAETGLTIRQVQRRAGYAYATIHNWETGRFEPSWTAFRNTMQAMGRPVRLHVETSR